MIIIYKFALQLAIKNLQEFDKHEFSECDNTHIPAQPIHSEVKQLFFSTMSLTTCCYVCKAEESDTVILDSCQDEETRCRKCKRIYLNGSRSPIMPLTTDNNGSSGSTEIEDDDISEIKKSLKFLCQQTVENEKKMNKLLNTVTGLTNNVNTLERQLVEKDVLIKDLTDRVETIEQNDKLNNLVINGVQFQSFADIVNDRDHDTDRIQPKANKEDTMASNFIKFAREKLEVTVNRNDIVKIYPISSNKETRSSRITLNSREKKAELFSAKKKLYQRGVQGVYINEDLTTRNFKILMAARKRKYEKKVEYVWTNECKVLVKTFATERQAARTYIIRTEADFEKYGIA